MDTGYLPHIETGVANATKVLMGRFFLRISLMSVSGLSTLELRNIIERAFLPARCRCISSESGTPSLTIEIYSEDADKIDLLVTGVDISSLNSSRAISNLIAEIKYDLKNNKRQFLVAHKRQ